eukprot:2957251-Rhodomonas_salina.2
MDKHATRENKLMGVLEFVPGPLPPYRRGMRLLSIHPACAVCFLPTRALQGNCWQRSASTQISQKWLPTLG